MSSDPRVKTAATHHDDLVAGSLARIEERLRQGAYTVTLFRENAAALAGEIVRLREQNERMRAALLEAAGRRNGWTRRALRRLVADALDVPLAALESQQSEDERRQFLEHRANIHLLVRE